MENVVCFDYKEQSLSCVSRLYLLAITIVINITKVLEESADTIAVGLAIQAENTKVCRLNENIYEIYIFCHLFCRRGQIMFVKSR
jgi:hypothetical protein